MAKEGFTKYEKARIIGARALQISNNAPLLINLSKEELKKLNYDPLRIAEREFEEGVLPISVERPMPLKAKTGIEKIDKEKILKEADKEIKLEEENIEELEESLNEESDEIEKSSSSEE